MLLHPINAFVDIILTLLGIITLVRLLHPLNDPIDIFIIFIGIFKKVASTATFGKGPV
jgi:hypothetical protein